MSTTKPSPRNDRAFISMMNAIKGANSSQGDKAEAGDIAAMLGSIKKLTLKPHQSQKLAHNEGMDTKNHPSHRELDAKLETIEARMDGRLARIEDRFISMENTMGQIGRSLEAQRNTPWKAAAATIAAMVATIIAVAALGFSAFDSGRDTEKIASEAKAEISSSVAEIKQMVQELKRQQEEIKP